MHAHAELWVPSLEGDLIEQVEAIMAPLSQDECKYDKDGEPLNEAYGLFDWFQVGGRWMNAHDPSYKPEKDPKNLEKCKVCNGTGIERDGGMFQLKRIHEMFKGKRHKPKACGQCKGTKKDAKWPTQWVLAPCVVIPVEKLNPKLTAYCIIINGDVVDDCEETNVAKSLKANGIKTGFLITLDYHS